MSADIKKVYCPICFNVIEIGYYPQAKLWNIFIHNDNDNNPCLGSSANYYSLVNFMINCLEIVNDKFVEAK